MTAALLRDVRWLGTARVVAYAKLFLVAYVPNLIFLFLLATGVIPQRLDVTPGTDFFSFWAAAQLTIDKGAAAAYDLALLAATQDLSGYTYPFMYPPSFLLVIAPLGGMSYLWAYVAWTGSTYAAYLSTARRLLPGGFWPMAALPAAFINAVGGQNGALTGALFCGATVTLKARPFLAGLLLGGFVVKPQLALLFPIAMIAGRQWKVIAGAVCSASMLVLASLLLFGADPWLAFMAKSGFVQSLLQSEHGLWKYMTSFFASARMLGSPLWLVYAGQAMIALLCAVLVFWIWRGRDDGHTKMAVLAICSALTTPYVFDYDLVLLTVPLCWVAGEGIRSGFRPWEKIGLAAVYLLPFINRGLSSVLSVNIAWCVVGAFLVLVVNRVRFQRRA